MCLSHGLELSLSSPSSISLTPHPLLQVLSCSSPHSLRLWSPLQASSARLLDQMDQHSSNSCVLSPLLWLLLAREMLALPPLSDTAVSSVLVAITGGFVQKDDTLALQTALDCLSLALSLQEVQSGVDNAWLAKIVPLVSGLARGEVCHYVIYSVVRGVWCRYYCRGRGRRCFHCPTAPHGLVSLPHTWTQSSLETAHQNSSSLPCPPAFPTCYLFDPSSPPFF